MEARTTFRTAGGVDVVRTNRPVAYRDAEQALSSALDDRRGLLIACHAISAQRRRGAVGFDDPPLQVAITGVGFRIDVLNERGQGLIGVLAAALVANPHLTICENAADRIAGRLNDTGEGEPPSFLLVLKIIIACFATKDDPLLGLYGALGHDVALHHGRIPLAQPRDSDQADVLMFLPDQLLVIDDEAEAAWRVSYQFNGARNFGRAKETGTRASTSATPDNVASGAFERMVAEATDGIRQGTLYAVNPSISFFKAFKHPPSQLYATLVGLNPSLHDFHLNLGDEQLVGTSPATFLTVRNGEIDSWPICGTARRGADAMQDAARVVGLLNSAKEEHELTICTDVDRADKALVCAAGTIQLAARRQILTYSHVVHTADHVRGVLRPGADACDAVLAHAWAVTTTGAPRKAALMFLEANETSPRRWYGGAVGRFTFDGGADFGVSIRFVSLRGGLAEIRAGAMLHAGSEPAKEAEEIRNKAAASLQSLDLVAAPPASVARAPAPAAIPLLIIDGGDPFIHLLRYCAEAAGMRAMLCDLASAIAALERHHGPILLSAPANGVDPASVDLARTLLGHGAALFGVGGGCHAIVAAQGGSIESLATPVNGAAEDIDILDPEAPLFRGAPRRCRAGIYASAGIVRAAFPAQLRIVATGEGGRVLAIEHPRSAVSGIWFHPASILSDPADLGQRLLRNALA